MADNTWWKYFENTKDHPPRTLLVEAVKCVKHTDEALDLGAGAFNDIRYLLSLGFHHITAVDKEPLAEKIVHNFPSDRVFYVISTFEDFIFPENMYDLVNAQYSLPFIAPVNFIKVLNSINSSLKKEGIFTGQLFGVHDEWNTENGIMTFHTHKEVEKLLSDYEIIDFKEEERDKNTAAGILKHWHVFHFIVKK